MSAGLGLDVNGKLWIMPVLLELFAFPFAWISVQMLHDHEPWKAIAEYALTGIALATAGVVWAVFRKRIAELWPWLLRRWRAPRVLAATLVENAELREQLDISRREKTQHDSDLWRAQESYRQCEEEKRAAILQMEELKTSSGIQPSLAPPPERDRLIKPRHNVQCTEFTEFTNEDFVTATLCFKNVPNGNLLGKFERPRLRVLYYYKPTGEEVADICPTEWWSESGNVPTEITADGQYAIVASFFREHGTWKALERIESPDDLELNSVLLPTGDIHIKASLSGANDLWIGRVEGILTLGEDGANSFRRTGD